MSGFSRILCLVGIGCLFISFVTQWHDFQVIKEDMERTLRNTNMKPLSHSSYSRLQVLCKSFYDVDEKLRVLNDLSLAQLKEFIPELRSQVHKIYNLFDNTV